MHKYIHRVVLNTANASLGPSPFPLIVCQGPRLAEATSCIFILLSNITALFSDVDECEERLDECVSNADCTDTDGSYTCECSPGYIGDGLVGCRRK